MSKNLSIVGRRISFVLVLLILVAGAIWYVALWSRDAKVAELRRTAEERLGLYESTINAALEKYRYLPFLISRNPSVKKLLGADPRDIHLAKIVSAQLKSANDKAGSDVLYVLDNTGTTLAASNSHEAVSFIGRNYNFRPYFKDALQGREGGLFAIGHTTGEPGYFISYPIVGDSGTRGVAVVKVDLSGLQREWRDGGETVFVSDRNGVIFLASREPWKYRSLGRLTPDTLQRIRSGRQYRGAELQRLPLEKGMLAGMTTAGVDGKRYLWAQRDLARLGWTLHYFSPAAPVGQRMQHTALFLSACAVLLMFAALLWRERQLRILARVEAREAQQTRAVNRKLEAQIEERRRAEQQLRQTQNELVQAGKLAGLGQMSAAIAHELNQPIAAIRTFAANGQKMLKTGDAHEAEITLDEIIKLSRRMADITGQLKTFARKSAGRLEDLDVRKPLHNALDMMESTIKLENIDVDTKGPESPLTVKGDQVRLEQVFVNLIRNAVDAMRESDRKRLSVSIVRANGNADISIADCGHGLTDESLEHLFEPFYTTKDVGDGVGLGLSITYGIVKDHGGVIRATNSADGGAVFTVSLPVKAND